MRKSNDKLLILPLGPLRSLSRSHKGQSTLLRTTQRRAMPQKPIRLPPLEVLRVKNPKRNPKNPCTVVMSSVLGTSFFSPALYRIYTGRGKDSLSGLSLPFANRLFLPPRIACWASAGYNAAGCAAIETQLRQCMDGPKPQPASPNTINHHMGRLGKHITYNGKPT